MKLGLGTVQFGLDYGVSNRGGQVGETEAGRILELALANGLTLLDTASTYGESEAVLGRVMPGGGAAFRLVTKTPVVREAVVEPGHGALLLEALEESLRRLGLERVHGLLVHHATDLLKPGGAHLIDALRRGQEAGRIGRIGVSVYTGEEIDAVLERFTPQIVQLPVSVADQRLLRSGHLARLRDLGVEIHARSILLQGLLLLDPAGLPNHFAPVADRFVAIRRAFVERGWSPLEGALRFGLELPELDVVLVGVTAVGELEEILAVAHRVARDPSRMAFHTLAIGDERFVNPVNWKVSR